jgi:hypothetical protein
MKRIILATVSAMTIAGVANAATDLADLDTDGDGSASYEEIVAIFPNLTKEEFAEVDTNGSNGWDADELLAGPAQGYLSRDEPRDAAETIDIKDVDADGDAQATFEEVTAKYPSITKEEFVEIDQNGSNTWDIDEIYTDAAQGYLKRM